MGKTNSPIVPRLWPDSTIVCLGCGPSLTQEDVNLVRGNARVIAVNKSWELAPWADVLYAADKVWWKEYDGVPAFAGLKFALPEIEHIMHTKWRWPDDVTVLQCTGHDGIETNPIGLRDGGIGGSNSGYQAINLAVHLGAKKIILLGYDMQRSNGRIHWFGNYPDDIHRNPPFAEFIKGFPTLVKPLKRLGIRIVNCSRLTALTCFEQQPIEQALAIEVAA